MATTMTNTQIPPLHQSQVEIMSCPHSYAVQVIEGKKMPGGLQSARGTEIHKVMSAYIQHCTNRKVAADWAEFDRLAFGAGAEAARILNGMRDNYTVDFEHVYDTELTLASDEGEAEGTLDVLLFGNPTLAAIDDFKSHPRPFDPAPTDQAKRYSFLVFEHFPSVEEVTFTLIFTRYANCRRSVTFTRADDYADLHQHILNSRRRQEQIHEAYATGVPLAALPGKHCQYCPLLQKPIGCPISEFNPETYHAETWARFLVWADQARKVASEALKNHVDASGEPIRIADANGRVTEIGFREHESRQYPLLKVLPLLMDYRHATPGDVAWIEKLLISSTKLKSYLKTKKRAFLHQCVEDQAAEPVTKTRFEISVPAEQDTDEERNEYEEE